MEKLRLVLILCYSAFRLPLSLLSYSAPVFVKDSVISVGSTPERIQFRAAGDNLGMVLSDLHAKIDEKSNYSDLWIRLFDSDQKLVQQISFNPNLVIDSRFHAFGFPQQQQSLGQLYTVEYEILPANPNIHVDINTSEGGIHPVYFMHKSDLLNFGVFSHWIFAKLREPFINPLFWLGMIFVVPFLGILNLLRFRKVRI